jgi:hypothetical protein
VPPHRSGSVGWCLLAVDFAADGVADASTCASACSAMPWRRAAVWTAMVASSAPARPDRRGHVLKRPALIGSEHWPGQPVGGRQIPPIDAVATHVGR